MESRQKTRAGGAEKNEPRLPHHTFTRLTSHIIHSGAWMKSDGRGLMLDAVSTEKIHTDRPPLCSVGPDLGPSRRAGIDQGRAYQRQKHWTIGINMRKRQA